MKAKMFSYKMIFFLVLFCFLVGSTEAAQKGKSKASYHKHHVSKSMSRLKKDDKIKILIPALIKHESGGKVKARGDHGRAWGVLQIHKGMVRDCNRIIGENKFSHSDADIPWKARKMCEIYLCYYTDEQDSIETMARLWNGGPNGAYERKTRKYWHRVKQHIKIA